MSSAKWWPFYLGLNVLNGEYYFCSSKGSLKGGGAVDLVLSCVDNFEARMAINAVSQITVNSLM